MPKVILIGSSDTLAINPMGHVIDEFDVVWRTNHTGHPDAIKLYPELLGSKYANWYCHDIPYSIFHVEDGRMCSKIPISVINQYEMILHNLFDVELEQLKRVGSISTSKAFKGIYKRCDKQAVLDLQEQEIINSNLLDSSFNNLHFGYLNWIKDCYSKLNEHGFRLKPPPAQKPSSGLRMLVYLLDRYDHVHLMGFNGGKTGHWYTNKKIKLNYAPNSDKVTTSHNRFGIHGNHGIAKHHLDLEHQFMKLMEKKGRVTIHE